jgi:5-deoxy-glucuronate isomerase
MSLAPTLFRRPRHSGLDVLLERGDGAARELTVRRLCLNAGEQADWTGRDEEAILVLQEGLARLRAGGAAWEVRRRGIFEQRATALYLPPGVPLSVAASSPLEAILVSTPVATGNATAGPLLLGPDRVPVRSRGRGVYTRHIHDIFVANPTPRRLLVGETHVPPGSWSSFPPHKHDGRDGDTRLEGIYYYRIDPPQGFAAQLLYTSEGESAGHTVRDGDLVLFPYGYHPLAAPPGYRVAYLWALAGEERRLALYEDPNHLWVLEEERQGIKE